MFPVVWKSLKSMLAHDRMISGINWAASYQTTHRP